MSDREDEPTDLFDVVCRLDDLVEWLLADYPAQAELLRDASAQLKDYIVISLPASPADQEPA